MPARQTGVLPNCFMSGKRLFICGAIYGMSDKRACHLAMAGCTSCSGAQANSGFTGVIMKKVLACASAGTAQGWRHAILIFGEARRNARWSLNFAWLWAEGVGAQSRR